eukprot:IDg11764t1
MEQSEPPAQHILVLRRNNPSSGSQARTEYTRKATYLHQYFSHTKFSGEIMQSIVMNVRDYENFARQHRISAAQNTEYLVSSLGRTARNLMTSLILPGMAFDEASALILREYDSESRQLQVQSSPEGLKLGSFMTSHSISIESKGLNKIL